MRDTFFEDKILLLPMGIPGGYGIDRNNYAWAAPYLNMRFIRVYKPP
jgi:hypothetical protein